MVKWTGFSTKGWGPGAYIVAGALVYQVTFILGWHRFGFYKLPTSPFNSHHLSAPIALVKVKFRIGRLYRTSLEPH